MKPPRGKGRGGAAAAPWIASAQMRNVRRRRTRTRPPGGPRSAPAASRAMAGDAVTAGAVATTATAAGAATASGEAARVAAGTAGAWLTEQHGASRTAAAGAGLACEQPQGTVAPALIVHRAKVA